MRNISILPDLSIVQIDGSPLINADTKQAVIKHVEFLLGRLADMEFTADIDSIAIGLVIREKLLELKAKETPVGQVLELEDAHWQKLCTSCRAPKSGGGATGYLPAIAHNLVPYINSVLNAKDPKKNAAES